MHTLEFANGFFRIHHCTIGAVVESREPRHDVDEPARESAGWGHITGFAINPLGQLIVKVLFADGAERERHPSNLKLYI